MNSRRRGERIISKAKASKLAAQSKIPVGPDAEQQQFKILVLAANTNRVQDFELSCKELAVCSIFSVHYKLEQHQRMV